MPFTRHWFVENKYLGKSVANKRWIGAHYVDPQGYHFFCDKCGRLWASCPVDGLSKHTVWSKPCADHAWKDNEHDFAAQKDRLYHSEIAGSLHMSWEKEFDAEMPPGVITWELKCHLRWAINSGMFKESFVSICRDIFTHLK